MTILRQTIILNTLADNAADAYVDSSGNLQLTGAAFGAPKATSCTLTRQNAVTEVLGVVTTTFTAVSGQAYTLKVFGGNNIQGGYNQAIKTYTYTATSTDTATTIGDAFRALINADVATLNIVATGTTTLICTAKTGFAEIVCTTTTANTSIVVTTQGVPSKGQGTALASNPNYFNGSTYGTFTAGATYTRWNIGWTSPNGAANPSSATTAQNEYVLFINDAATSSGSNTDAMNLAFIQGSNYTYADSVAGTSIYKGTLVALQAGLRAIVTSPATTTAAITAAVQFVAATSGGSPTAAFNPAYGTIALASGAATFSTLDAQVGDVIYISASGGTAFTTHKMTTIANIASTTAGSGTYNTAVSAAVFKIVQYRQLPR